MSDLYVTPQATDHGAVANHGSFNEMTNGLSMIDGAADAAAALGSGDFVEAGIHGVSAALDTVGMIFNPVAGVVSAVAEFFIEHCGPLQSWIDEMLGDPSVIQAGAQSWTNIGNHLEGIGPDYRSLVDNDLGDFSGLAITAYRGVADLNAAVVSSLAQISHGVSGGVVIAGQVLAGVREFIVGLVSDLVGFLVDTLAKIAFTAGLATPFVGTGAVMKAREVITKCRDFMKSLARTLDKFASLIDDVAPAMAKATRLIARIATDKAGLPVDTALDFVVSMGKGATA